MGDLSWCDQGSQHHTWVYRYESLPYSPTDPLLATFTGGKTNVREPYYPSYETTSNSCDADRDKFSSTITITFNKPIANFRTRLAHYMNQAINYTVTANNGSMAIVGLAPYQGQPGFGTVKEVVLPGDNITSVTIRPNSFGPDGSWRFLVYHDLYVTWPPSYTNCNCNRSTFARPANQTVSTSWPGAFGTDPNWNMQVNVSDQDGLVLTNVKLGQRYLVEKISVPYFYLETSALAPTRGELKPDGSETSMRSRLVNYYVQKDADKLVIEAQYVIDKITASSLSCLQITQRYEF